MTPRRYIILAIITLTSALGDTFLAHGMKQLGPVSLHHLSTLLLALKIPWVLAGIVLLIGFFASYLAALSWADVTFVLPASSLAYVVVALLSRFWLHEQITPARWLGIFCIVAGVGFVTRGPAYTEHPAADAAALQDSEPSVPICNSIAQPGAKATMPNGAKATIPNGAKAMMPNGAKQ
jgi:drug/metabolite transporter (DMT)-like permease